MTPCSFQRVEYRYANRIIGIGVNPNEHAMGLLNADGLGRNLAKRTVHYVVHLIVVNINIFQLLIHIVSPLLRTRLTSAVAG
jgi:hypothetical protein